MALGMALGVFSGMMPIMPFQTALAVALALFFRGSKLAAAIGTWVSNPLNWYFIYFWNYKLGAFILKFPEKNEMFASVMEAIQSGEEPMVIVGKILHSGSMGLGAFLIGGISMGIVSAFPAYFIFFPVFRRIKLWRESRRRKKNR